jgi:hypothetical protein
MTQMRFATARSLACLVILTVCLTSSITPATASAELQLKEDNAQEELAILHDVFLKDSENRIRILKNEEQKSAGDAASVQQLAAYPVANVASHGLRRLANDDANNNNEEEAYYKNDAYYAYAEEDDDAVYYDDSLKEMEYQAGTTLWDMFENPMHQWTRMEWVVFAFMLFFFGCLFFFFCCCCIIPRCCGRRTADVYAASLLV